MLMPFKTFFLKPNLVIPSNFSQNLRNNRNFKPVNISL